MRMKRKVSISRRALFCAMLAGAALAAASRPSAAEGSSGVEVKERSTGQVVDDATITAKVKSALATSSQVKARDVNVDTRNGVVELSGVVGSQDEIDAALVLARRVEGVRSVTNSMSVADSR